MLYFDVLVSYVSDGPLFDGISDKASLALERASQTVKSVMASLDIQYLEMYGWPGDGLYGSLRTSLDSKQLQATINRRLPNNTANYISVSFHSVEATVLTTVFDMTLGVHKKITLAERFDSCFPSKEV